MRPVLVRNFMREPFIDSLRENLVDLGQRMIERFVRNVHRAGWRLSVTISVDLNNVEFGKRKGAEEELVIVDEIRGEIRQLFGRAVVLETVGRDADRTRPMLLFE